MTTIRETAIPFTDKRKSRCNNPFVDIFIDEGLFDDHVIRLIASGTELLRSVKSRVQNEDKELEEILARKRSKLLSAASVESRRNAVISTPIELTDSNFAHAIARYPLLVIDFWAPWCGPCRIVSPIIEQLANDHAGKVVFGKVNIDENPLSAAAFSIQSIPTITIFKNGSAVDGFTGAASKSQIQAKLSAYMQSGTDAKDPN
ncbi:MAG TPA: thioredoxin [Candidatus Nitrosopolaris sp.]|nr:thioredoxin [Candidatus Nitrosopolaris sp.]